MKILLILCLVFTGTLVRAQYSSVTTSPYPVEVIQPDGTKLTIYGKGDENNHYSVSEDGYTVLLNKEGFYEYANIDKEGRYRSTGIRARNISERKLQEKHYLENIDKFLEESVINVPQQKSTSETTVPQNVFPSSGSKKAVMLLIKYPDLDDTYSTSQFYNFMNQNNFNGTGSFRDYYLDASNNNLSMNVDVVGWYVAAHNYDYYGEDNGKSRSQELVGEAIDAAEAAGVDFSQYDNDNNGVLDNLFVVHSGPGAEEGSRNQYVWSHSWYLGGSARNYDGVYISSYIIMPETRSYGMVGIGVFCHEFGHALGLPDLYDTNTSNGDSEGLGNWCLMAGGGWLNQEKTPALLSAWNREKLGWINPSVINAQGSYSLSPAATSTDCYKILTSKNNEYFLLENRYKTGFDSKIPGSGLAIYHINSLKGNNADETNKLVDLEEADGNDDLDNEVNRGDSGDVFPGGSGKTDFNDTTYPDAKNYDGTATGISISNISLSGSTVSFDLGAQVQQGIDLTFDSVANNLIVSSTMVDIDLKLKNTGAQNSASFKVGYYLSSDANFSTSDYLIGTSTVSSLNAGATLTRSFNVDAATVVPAIPAGNYYVGFIVDYQSVVGELEEGNNTFAFSSPQVTIPGIPNLTFDSRQNSISISGYDVTVDLQVENTGNDVAGACKIGFYVSTSKPVNTGDLFIGELSLSSLNAGNSVNKTFSADVLAAQPSLPEGNYYVGYVIDYVDGVSESVENDNSYTFSSPKVDNYFIPNLTYNSIDNNLTINNSIISLDFNVKNNGDAASITGSAGVYISKSKPVKTSDIKIGEVPFGALNPGNSESLNFSENITDFYPQLSAGKYYVGYKIDFDNKIDEDNESDNLFTFIADRVDIYSNLKASSTKNSFQTNTTQLTFAATIVNDGFTSSGVNKVKFYLSSDNNIDESDFYIDEFILDEILRNDTLGANLFYNITQLENQIEKGPYFVGFIIDSENDVAELNEQDNTFVFANKFNYCPLDATVFPETICAGDSILFRNSYYKTAGVYEFSFLDESGCDSVIILDLTVNPVSETFIDTTVCYGESVSISNIEYTESGEFQEVFENQYGCDSTVHLTLYVQPILDTVITAFICEGQEFDAAGSVYTKSGTYTSTLQNSFGCDSVVTVDLTVYPNSDTLIDKTICYGDSVVIENSVYKTSGQYKNNLTNRFGCDSLVTLNLVVNPVNEIMLNKTICDGDSVFVGPYKYTTGGVYINTFENRFGCDSMVVLNLTVNPVNDTLLSIVVCQGESVKIGNTEYDETGTFIETLENRFGCDSIVTLDLIVNPVDTTLLDEIICMGDSVVVGASSYNQSGSYTDVLTNQFGCDSTVHLNLTVNPVHYIEIVENICEGSKYFHGDKYYSESGTYDYLFQNSYGCDSMVVLHLNVVPLPQVDLGDDFVLFSSETKSIDAGGGFANYSWSTGENTPSITIDKSRGLGKKEYLVTVTDQYSCSSSDNIVVTIYDDQLVDTDKEPLLKVFPNPSHGNINLLIEQITGKYTLKVISRSGGVMFQKEFTSPNSKFVKRLNFSHLPPGVYAVQVANENNSLVEKFIITQF